MKYNQLLIAILCTLLGLLSPVLAQEENGNTGETGETGIGAALRGLKWGVNHQEVMKFLEKEIKEQFDVKIEKARDDIEVDRLRIDLKKSIDNLKNAYTSFTGQRTGYEVSLIKNDFSHNNSETLIRIDDSNRQRYYFFRYDRLFKLLVAYSNTITGDAGFEGFVAKVEEKYGNPAKVDWDTPQGGGRVVVRAIWQDTKTQLVVEDFSTFYGRYSMKFVSVEQGLEIEELHSKKSTKATGGTGTAVNIFAEEEDKGENVIDQITGVKHEVNLKRITKEERASVKQKMLEEEQEEEKANKKGKKKGKKEKEKSEDEGGKNKKINIQMQGDVY